MPETLGSACHSAQSQKGNKKTILNIYDSKGTSSNAGDKIHLLRPTKSKDQNEMMKCNEQESEENNNLSWKWESTVYLILCNVGNVHMGYSSRGTEVA